MAKTTNYKDSKPGGNYSKHATNNRPGGQRSNPNNGPARQGQQQYQGPGRAPYNFIPLNEIVLGSEYKSREEIPASDRYHQDKHTGYIDLQLETITPLYIRDTSDNPEQESKDNPDFFSPAGRVKIPGSSLRGMVRNLVEIVSFGKFGFFEDRRLYYRGLADKCMNMRNEYQRNMSSRDRVSGKTNYKFNAGYLTKEGFEYFIIPAEWENGKQFIQVLKEGPVEEFLVKKKLDGKHLVISGKIQGKKRDWLINAPDLIVPKIEVPESDIWEYRNDETRFKDKRQRQQECKDGDLLRQLEISQKKLIPCFYVKWKDKSGKDRVSFGHTGYFRLAYQYSVGDHIPSSLVKSEIIDITEGIFGKETQFSTRVFFEDAELLPNQDKFYMEVSIPKVLGSPKPTTFQHYLVQKKGAMVKELRHWNNPDAAIRGYKYYWHRDTQDPNSPFHWRETGEVKQNVSTTIRPIRPGVNFRGRIRFENLSAEELGALLFVLNLPENHYHKLGMGKPLGLGSVKISATLILSDRQERYTSLFSGNSWHLAEKEKSSYAYIRKFENFVLNKLGEKEVTIPTSLWDIPRLKQLMVMLDWAHNKQSEWLRKTNYQELKEFKNRPVLPNPEEVIK